MPALQRAHGIDRKPGHGRKFLLREARRLAKRLELRTKWSWSAWFHDPFIVLLRLYDRRTSAVRMLSVVAGLLALHTGPERFMSNRLSRPSTVAAIGESFDEVVLPHLDAAYRLARWLLRNEHDAEDVVQEASLRAFRYFRTFAGGNGRAWFLRIVRNTCFDQRDRFQTATDSFDEEQHSSARPASDPETLVLQTDDTRLIEQALRNVSDRFRELLVLRELEDLTYREMADVMEIPIGTVMSGLSRARQVFRRALNNELKRSGIPERTHPREREADAVLV